jgi:hypothetical protein
MFVDINNTVYVSEQSRNQVQVWAEGSINPMKTISGSLSAPHSIFVTIDGDVYIDNGGIGQVMKWTLNTTSSVVVMSVSTHCYGLFIDISNNLYCSIKMAYQVVAMSLNSSANTPTIVAGNGSSGSTSNMLYWPNGIFVDISFNLYVADSGNNRIQKFEPGQLNGTTVAGNQTTGTIALNSPHGVVLDGDNYLFIVDGGNNRIVGQGPNGFRCLVGCSGSSGSTSNELSNPMTLSFDSYGNMFVTDWGNNRIQTFNLITDSCGMFD